MMGSLQAKMLARLTAHPPVLSVLKAVQLKQPFTAMHCCRV